MSVVTRLEDGYVRLLLAGRYSFQEVIQRLEELAGEQGAEPGLGLLDISASEEIRSSEELRTLAHRLVELGLFSKMAVLVDGSSPRFGLGRMLEVFAEDEGIPVRVFRAEADALPWLRSDL